MESGGRYAGARLFLLHFSRRARRFFRACFFVTRLRGLVGPTAQPQMASMCASRKVMRDSRRRLRWLLAEYLAKSWTNAAIHHARSISFVLERAGEHFDL